MAATAVGFLIGHQSNAGPLLDAPVVVELGTVDHGEYKRVFIPVKNTGDRPLELDPMRTGCSCTVGTLIKTILQPGEVANAEVIFHAAQAPGAAIRQAVILVSNCRIAKERQVELRGTMRGSLVAVPALAHIDAYAGEPWEREIAIFHSNTDVNFCVIDASISLSSCDLSFYERGVEKSGTIRLRSRELLAPGTYRGSLLVVTDLSEFESIKVPIEIEIHSQMKCSPKPLIFRRNPGTSEYESE
ncbi:MAG: DUF1573 domain-containing protein, partial [Schlesneria sp.]